MLSVPSDEPLMLIKLGDLIVCSGSSISKKGRIFKQWALDKWQRIAAVASRILVISDCPLVCSAS